MKRLFLTTIVFAINLTVICNGMEEPPCRKSIGRERSVVQQGLSRDLNLLIENWPDVFNFLVREYLDEETFVVLTCVSRSCQGVCDSFSPKTLIRTSFLSAAHHHNKNLSHRFIDQAHDWMFGRNLGDESDEKCNARGRLFCSKLEPLLGKESSLYWVDHKEMITQFAGSFTKTAESVSFNVDLHKNGHCRYSIDRFDCSGVSRLGGGEFDIPDEARATKEKIIDFLAECTIFLAASYAHSDDVAAVFLSEQKLANCFKMLSINRDSAIDQDLAHN